MWRRIFKVQIPLAGAGGAGDAFEKGFSSEVVVGGWKSSSLLLLTWSFQEIYTLPRVEQVLDFPFSCVAEIPWALFCYLKWKKKKMMKSSKKFKKKMSGFSKQNDLYTWPFFTSVCTECSITWRSDKQRKLIFPQTCSSPVIVQLSLLFEWKQGSARSRDGSECDSEIKALMHFPFW